MSDRDEGSERMSAVLASCPACGARPALRLSSWAAARLMEAEPRWRVASYKCQRRGCGTIYDICAGAVKRAE